VSASGPVERSEVERLGAIEQSAPPASSFEGRVKAWRDARAAPQDEFEVVWNGGPGLSSYQQGPQR